MVAWHGMATMAWHSVGVWLGVHGVLVSRPEGPLANIYEYETVAALAVEGQARLYGCNVLSPSLHWCYHLSALVVITLSALVRCL